MAENLPAGYRIGLACKFANATWCPAARLISPTLALARKQLGLGG
ncbi:hypothetical protein [Nitrosomonas sp.]